LLTFAYTTNGAPNKEVIRKEVLRTCEEFVSESVEKKKNLRDFSLEKGYGAYCLFTDASLVGKKAKPGDYKIEAGIYWFWQKIRSEAALRRKLQEMERQTNGSPNKIAGARLK